MRAYSRLFRLGRGCRCATLALLCLAATWTQSPGETPQDKHQQSSISGWKGGAGNPLQGPFDWSPDAPVFSLDGKTYTVQEVTRLMNTIASPTFQKEAIDRNPRYGFWSLNSLDREQLKSVAEEITQVLMGAGQANGKKLAAVAGTAENKKILVERLQMKVWEQLYMSKWPTPSEAAVQEWYQDHKEIFRILEETRIRTIFLATYQGYTVQTGDTLESIAQRISGDASRKDGILDAGTRQPRHAPRQSPGGGGSAPEILTPGEKLLVPMGADGVAQVEARARKAMERLKAGEEFCKVAEEVSESPYPGQLVVYSAASDRPMMKELREAVSRLKDGEFSDPIRTRHGIQIVFRESAKEDGYAPISEVHDYIIGQMKSEEREGMVQTGYKAVMEANNITVDEEVLAHVTDADYRDRAILAYRSQAVTAGDFMKEFDSVTTSTTLAERKTMVLGSMALRQALLRPFMVAAGVTESPEYLARLGYVNARQSHLEYLQDRVKAVVKEPTEEEIKARYEQKKDELRHDFAAELWQLTLKANFTPKATDAQRAEAVKRAAARLSSIARDIHSLEDFQAAARKYSADIYKEAGGSYGTVNDKYLDGINGLLPKAKPNSLLGPPVERKDEAVLYYVRNVTPARQKTLEEARSQLVDEINQERWDKTTAEINQELLTKSDFKFLLTADADKSPNKGAAPKPAGS